MSQRLRSQWNGASGPVDVAVQLVQLAHDRLECLDLLPTLALVDGRLGDIIGPDTTAIVVGEGRRGGYQGRKDSEAGPSPPGRPIRSAWS